MNARRFGLACVAAVVGVVPFVSSPARAATAADTQFGVGGRAVTDWGDEDGATSAVVQPDGKIVVGGWATRSFVFQKQRGTRTEYALSRFNTDGTLDPSFGDAGRVTSHASAAPYRSDAIDALALQPDGKILAAGWAADRGMGLARYNVDGSLDASFSGSSPSTPGFGEYGCGFTFQTALAIALQGDGKILLAGHGHWKLCLLRIDRDGSLDTTFAHGGVATIDLNPRGEVNTYAFGAAVAVQPDGGIVVAGGYRDDVKPNAANGGWLIARFTARGALDPTFGARGLVRLQLGADDAARALALLPGGALLVAGTAGERFAAVRLTEGGALDPAFGHGGKITTAFAGKRATALSIALTPDGGFFLAGTAATSALSDPTYQNDMVTVSAHAFGGTFAIARYRADGALDRSFGARGTEAIGGGLAAAFSARIDANGRLLLAGIGRRETNDFVLVRFTAAAAVAGPVAGGGHRPGVAASGRRALRSGALVASAGGLAGVTTLLVLGALMLPQVRRARRTRSAHRRCARTFAAAADAERAARERGNADLAQAVAAAERAWDELARALEDGARAFSALDAHADAESGDPAAVAALGRIIVELRDVVKEPAGV